MVWYPRFGNECTGPLPCIPLISTKHLDVLSFIFSTLSPLYSALIDVVQYSTHPSYPFNCYCTITTNASRCRDKHNHEVDLAGKDMILYNNNTNCSRSGDDHGRTEGNNQNVNMPNLNHTAPYPADPVEVASNRQRIETFCRAVVDLASLTRKKVSAVNYTGVEVIDDSSLYKIPVFESDRGYTRHKRMRRSKRWSSKRMHREMARSKESDPCIEKSNEIRWESQRLKQSNVMTMKNKTFVKYSMSKTPQFLKNPDFLRCVAAASHGVSLRGSTGFETAIKNSLIWIPEDREAWLDCLDELACLCSEASLRWALNAKSLTLLSALTSTEKWKQQPLSSNVSKLIQPIPLSKAYIHERLDIDDPLHGYQIRHSHGGWLQGFVTWTTFTTWTRFFQWNSLHPAAGMPTNIVKDAQEESRYDKKGNFAKELEKVYRSGDPHINGVIWPSIAEIGLVGALGCGEYLLQMALEDIANRGCYNYVVLQATETSLSFYEKFGFVRVGAVCTYGQSDEICGYRHWTYADEKNLDVRHGGPSYMMVQKLEPLLHQKQNDASDAIPLTGIWEALQNNVAKDKPTILPGSEQDNYIMKHPNPATPSIMDMMKKGNKWWKDFNSKSCCEPAKVTTTFPSSIKRLDGRRYITSNEESALSSSAILATRSASNQVSQRDNGGYKRKRHEEKAVGNEMETEIVINPRTRIRSKQLSNPEVLDASIQKPICRMEKDRILKQRFNDKPNVKDANPFFFNKVVALKRPSTVGSRGPYYFVVHYEKNYNKLTLIELEPHGNFLGRLKHRIRWRAVGRDMKEKKSLLKVADGSKYEIIPAEMITKSSCIHEEGWNLLTD